MKMVELFRRAALVVDPTSRKRLDGVIRNMLLDPEVSKMMAVEVSAEDYERAYAELVSEATFAFLVASSMTPAERIAFKEWKYKTLASQSKKN